MRIQTSHLLECQSHLIDPQADLPLTRKELPVIPATELLRQVSTCDKIYKLIFQKKETSSLYLSHQTIVKRLSGALWITNKWFISKVM